MHAKRPITNLYANDQQTQTSLKDRIEIQKEISTRSVTYIHTALLEHGSLKLGLIPTLNFQHSAQTEN